MNEPLDTPAPDAEPDPSPRSTGGPAWRILVPAGLLQGVLLVCLAWWPGATFPLPASALFLGAFALYALAAWRIKDAVGGTVSIWVLAVAMRIALLPVTPELSGEIYRYLWDGQAQLAGINPYLHPPASTEMAGLRTPWQALLEHPEARSVHPPFAQLLFLAVALAGGAIAQAKLLWLGFDLATAWILGRVARATGRSRRLTWLLYLWSPLLLVEVAWNGHMESVALFAMAVAILLARAPVGAGVAAGLAALVRWPLVFPIPAVGGRLGSRFLGGVVLAGVLATLPYALAGPDVLAGALTALSTPPRLEGLFTLLTAVVPDGPVVRGVVVAFVAGAAVWAAAGRFRTERSLFWTVGAFLLLTPVLNPWYALWILPMAALRVSLPWLLLTGVAFLGYWNVGAVPGTVVPAVPGTVRLAVWVPVLLLLLRDADRYWRTRVPLPPIRP